jgi:hypothetical protein
MMPAGEYYVGDLCYVMTDEEWNEFCSITIKGHQCLDGEFTMKDGRRFATYGTAWGDGLYQDQNGGQYSVDAGLIGCIKVEDIRAKKYADISELGKIHNFQYDFTTHGGRNADFEWNGVISIGHIHIKTDDDEWEDDEQ